MFSTNKKNSSELLLRLIRTEKYLIKNNSVEIIQIIDDAKNFLEMVRNDHINHPEVRSDPRFNKIHNVITEISLIHERLNCSKKRISDYRHQLYLLNGFYTSQWED